MQETQSFRLFGKNDVVEITLDNANGQNIINWEDIKQVFPGVTRVMNGRVAINMLKDSNRRR